MQGQIKVLLCISATVLYFRNNRRRWLPSLWIYDIDYKPTPVLKGHTMRVSRTESPALVQQMQSCLLKKMPWRGCDGTGTGVQQGPRDGVAIWYAVIQRAPWQHWELSAPQWCAFLPFILLCVLCFFISKLSCFCALQWKFFFSPLLILPFRLPTSLPNISQSLYLKCKKNSHYWYLKKS